MYIDEKPVKYSSLNTVYCISIT